MPNGPARITATPPARPSGPGARTSTARRRAATVGLIAAFVLAACGGATPTASLTVETLGPTPAPSPSSSEVAIVPPTPTPSPTPSPEPTPGALGGERLTVLVIGLDTLAGRTPTRLTDSMLIASIDPLSNSASMLSLPRDLVDVPMPGGQLYRAKLNGLYAAVRGNPGAFKGGDVGPARFLADTLEATLDITIDHWVEVDMNGFAKVIDALGGVDVRVDDGFCDPGYTGLGLDGFRIPVGTYHLDGAEALAFARVRKAAGESDFQRMFRQQDLLVAIGEALRAGGATKDPLELLASFGKAVRTDLPPELIVEAATVAAAIPRDRIHARVAEPTRFVTEASDSRGYVLLPNLDELRRYAGYLFGPAGVRPKTGAPKEADIPLPTNAKNLPAFGGC